MPSSPIHPRSIHPEGRTKLKTSALLLAASLLLAPSLSAAQLTAAATAPSTPEDRAKALHSIFHDYWD